jgi:hypothetical protein
MALQTIRKHVVRKIYLHAYGIARIWNRTHMESHAYGIARIWNRTHMESHAYGMHIK